MRHRKVPSLSRKKRIVLAAVTAALTLGAVGASAASLGTVSKLSPAIEFCAETKPGSPAPLRLWKHTRPQPAKRSRFPTGTLTNCWPQTMAHSPA